MSTAYIRDIDENTYAVLQKEAKRRGISLSELVRQILNQYVSRREIETLDQKYRTFVQEQIILYRMDQAEIRQLVTKNEQLYFRLMEIMERMERWDD